MDFLDALDRLSARNYCPSETDVLYARTKTTGVNELRYAYRNTELLIVDVGGQKSERRRWIKMFDGVNAVLFIAAISEYDQRMDEAPRMLFAEIGNHTLFKHVHIILFLNKKDLFETKIQKVHLRVCFPKYRYKNDYTNAAKYITKKFKRQILDDEKIIYPHLTCAMDTDHIKFVMNSVTDMIITESLRYTGIVR
ncbi:guanine nucleotide binding protein alpha transducing activity polypeptide 2 [Aphelenchoides avenae]|nr:guanine nucleotide binding protein alpha transducing activity polypeptide 2 [Aphelenchus avenae]